MKNTRTRKRSTSEKRKRSTSRTKDDDLLIKALNQKVASDNQILISKDQYEELLSIKKQYKEVQVRAYTAEVEVAKLQEQNRLLEKAQEKSPSNSLQNSLISSNPDNQKLLENLKSSFSDIDHVLKLKSRAGRKYLISTFRHLKDLERSIEDISSRQKPKMLETLKQMSSSLDSLLKIFTQHADIENESDPEVENLKLKKELSALKEKTEGYKGSLHRLQDQTKHMKKRLMEVEISGPQKRTIEEQEMRIDLLEQEKELLSQHVRSLQSTLTEQCQIISHLKDAFQSLQQIRTETTTPTPKRTKEPSLHFSRTSQEDYLQDEIETLDLEIQQLQQSLQKALSNN